MHFSLTDLNITFYISKGMVIYQAVCLIRIMLLQALGQIDVLILFTVLIDAEVSEQLRIESKRERKLLHC